MKEYTITSVGRYPLTDKMRQAIQLAAEANNVTIIKLDHAPDYLDGQTFIYVRFFAVDMDQAQEFTETLKML
jgi:hypothetical protein